MGGPPPAEFLLVAVVFTFVMAAFGYAVHVVSGAAADLSYSVARGVADGVRRWAAAAAGAAAATGATATGRSSSHQVDPVTVIPVRASRPRLK